MVVDSASVGVEGVGRLHVMVDADERREGGGLAVVRRG